MKSAVWGRGGLFFGVLFFILSNFAWAFDPNDPGNPDTVYLENGGIAGATLTIKVMFVTDNVGDTNKIAHLASPLKITNSNPNAKPVLDTTVSATYSGSAVGGWPFLTTYVIPPTDSIVCDTFVTCAPVDPCLTQPGCSCLNDTTLCCDSIVCDTFPADRVRTFPLRYWLTAFGSGSSLGAGRYHFANIVLRLQDTTTICIDTFLAGSFRLRFTKVTSNGYTPQSRNGCFQADFSFKPGDVNCSGGNANLGDIVYLTGYVFKGGLAPCIKKLGDVNCSGGNANLSDIIYLVNYVFKGGPAPLSCL